MGSARIRTGTTGRFSSTSRAQSSRTTACSWTSTRSTARPNDPWLDLVLFPAVDGVHRRLDHAFLNDFAPFDKISPTSENLARWIYEQTVEALTFERARLASVTVKEYENSIVTYRPA